MIRLNYYVTFDNTEIGVLEIDPSKSFRDALDKIYATAFHDYDEKSRINLHDLVLYKPKDVEMEPKDSLFDRATASLSEASSVNLDEEILTTFESSSSDVLHVIVDAPEFAERFFPIEAKRLEKLTREADDSDMPKFYKGYWRNKTVNEVLRMDVLPLAFDEDHKQLVVHASYRTLFQRASSLRRKFPEKGVLVTDELGTDTTGWLWFMLVCVIASRKPVAFHYHGKTRLLVHGDVYLITDSPSRFFKRLSKSPTVFRQVTTWCLVETDEGSDPPVYLVESGTPIFPVQASSPNSTRYVWRRDVRLNV
ncbi:hypothetical protein BDN72DRAFT_891275 [Pluteus cervinus]|uniref:Uncharacterized protein n=1 Tax=Pluteus cervinus TaxID=181527 RepID=A0ACD3BI07_9AGAR|nr:hypothetical protein BDN72DRAFT_891275 [Pluteus cervinus]